jgi:hypothetical protein
MISSKIFRTILTLVLFVVILSSVGWLLTPQVAQAVPPAQEEVTGLTIEVVGPDPATVQVGDVFTVDVVADSIPAPGIFGYQFVLSWDGGVFSPINATTNADFSVLGKNDLGDSSYAIAASREGNVDDLTGPLTLVTLEVQADVATDPESSSFTLADVKLGRKGGFDVPVETVINLDVVVLPDGTGGEADIAGNVTVEGRAADNQDGHDVSATGDLGAVLSATTEISGDFLIESAPADTYDMTANSPGFLAATCEDVAHGTELTDLNDVVLLAGDIDDDGAIDITDAVAIGAVFGSTEPGEIADLNVDGEVDVLDLILMAVNFEQTSAGNPWVCQAG